MSMHKTLVNTVHTCCIKALMPKLHTILLSYPLDMSHITKGKSASQPDRQTRNDAYGMICQPGILTSSGQASAKVSSSTVPSSSFATVPCRYAVDNPSTKMLEPSQVVKNETTSMSSGSLKMLCANSSRGKISDVSTCRVTKRLCGKQRP